MDFKNVRLYETDNVVVSMGILLFTFHHIRHNDFARWCTSFGNTFPVRHYLCKAEPAYKRYDEAQYSWKILVDWGTFLSTAPFGWRRGIGGVHLAFRNLNCVRHLMNFYLSDSLNQNKNFIKKKKILSKRLTSVDLWLHVHSN